MAQRRKERYFCRALMSRHDFQIPVLFKHRVVFTRNAFAPTNPELADIVREGGGRRAIAFLEESVAAAWPGLPAAVEAYFTGLDL
ncbi:MAG: hypothetical protein WCP45_17715, partial [Verrucomicrobiota bacterium]